MERVGLVLKCTAEHALRLGERITRFIRDRGKDILLEESCGHLANDWKARTTNRISDESDLLVVLGGDGTILRAAALINSDPPPVLGVNLGRVGYMAEISPDEALDELAAVLDGTAKFVNRMMLQVELPDGTQSRVLNDVVFHWSSIARLIDLGVKVGESKEIEVRADGLIVATPIGSSAYSFAASGPLVHPEVEALLLTPICPYSGLHRPVIVPPNLPVEITLKRGEASALTLDGHTLIGLDVGSTIRIARSDLPFVMVKSRAKDYIDLLEEKLGLL